MDEVIVHVEAEVNPTESEEKVKKAIENVLGALQLHSKPNRKQSILVGEHQGREVLTNLHDLLHREQIRAAARMALLEGVSGETIQFCLNKQVAYAGHVSFAKEVAESPLGPIKVRIACKNPRKLVEWLTSSSR